MTIEVNDHEHVWVRHTPALSFILLEADPLIYCDVCGVPAVQCPYRSSVTGVQCELIDGHEAWEPTRFHKFSPPAGGA